MPSPSPLRRMILVTLLNSQARIYQGVYTASGLRNFHDVLPAELAGRFPREAANLSSTDLMVEWNALLREAPDYRAWWTTLAAASGVRLDLAERQPRIPIDAVEAWEGLLDHLDGDALTTAFLHAQRPGADGEKDVRALGDWGVTLVAGDQGLEVLWRRGLSDLHIHAGGVRFAQFAWFDLMDGSARPGDFEKFGREEERLLRQAKEARAQLWEKASPPPEDRPLEDDGKRWGRWDSRRLLGERIMLARLWGKPILPPETLVPLDRYLFIKSRFFREARQPMETAPGLQTFHRYFRFLERPRPIADQSARLAMGNYSDALTYLGECRNLRRIELRAGPANNAPSYASVAKSFGEAVENFNQARAEKVDVRLAIHFKRKREAGELQDTLKTLDRQTAALREALFDEQYGPYIRKWVSRIDVAGWERDTQASMFVPYLRLARGDEQATADLANLRDDDPRACEFEYWLRLRKMGRHRFSLAESRLGLTVHAGEDYADPLDGLHQVHTAMTGFDMRPGDGIGHGLAMTCDVEAFYRDRAVFAFIPRGAHLDSAIWLLELIETRDSTRQFLSFSHELHADIACMTREIYGPAFDIADLKWLAQARLRPRTPEFDRLPDHRRRLWRLDASPCTRRVKDELIALTPERLRLTPVVRWAQGQVLGEARRRRVVVELNPASNLRVSGAGALALSPTVKLLLEIESGLLASINTDNPGIFLSRVENEYALLLAGCRSLQIPESRARGLLEEARRIGLEETWWPPQSFCNETGKC